MPKKGQETPIPILPARRRLRGWFIGITSLVLLLVAAAGVYAFYYQDRIVPHTTIGGVAVGGLTPSQAENVLLGKEKSFVSRALPFNYQLKTWQVAPNTFDLTFQTKSAVATAYQLGRQGSFPQQVNQLLQALFVPHAYALATQPVTEQDKTKLPVELLKEVEIPFTETGLSFRPGSVIVVAGKNGQLLDLSQLNHDLAAAFAGEASSVTLHTVTTIPKVTPAEAEPARAQADQLLSAPWTIQVNGHPYSLAPADILPWLSTNVQDSSLSLIIDQAKLKAYVTDLAAKVQQKPINAILTVNNGAVSLTQDGKDGLSLEVDPTVSAISTALLTSNPSSRTITGVTEVDHPDVWSGNLASLGLNQLIGTGTTDFTGSPSNRVENITIGEKMISGQLIKAGAEFSTVNALGPIDEAHGYVQGLVIVNNQTLPADGGGLCQVSTTLFRSVLNAGLPVTARTAHSYEVSYYQRGIGPGLDATIYDPSPDFKWKNDTGHDIFIQGTIKGTTLTFDLYGTSDGRTVSIDGPHTLQTFAPPTAPLYVNTDTLAKGVTEYIDPPVPGAKTTATYTVTRNGQQINKQTFNSFYQAMPAQYLVGTK